MTTETIISRLKSIRDTLQRPDDILTRMDVEHLISDLEKNLHPTLIIVYPNNPSFRGLDHYFGWGGFVVCEKDEAMTFGNKDDAEKCLKKCPPVYGHLSPRIELLDRK